MVASPQYLTPEEYLALELESQNKHEYRNGQVYAMAGASNNHGTIALNLATLLRIQLRGSGCRPYIADTKVRIEPRNIYYYPDVVVGCDPRERGRDSFLRYPRLIAEVLSETTEAFDRGDKFADYRSLESLQDYVLISQNKVAVEVFQRDRAGWMLRPYDAADELILPSVDFRCPITALYEDVVFELDESA